MKSYISYTLGLQLRHLNADFTLNNCLFGYVKLTKKADPDKYKYSIYGIGFDLYLKAWEKNSLFLELI